MGIPKCLVFFLQQGDSLPVQVFFEHFNSTNASFRTSMSSLSCVLTMKLHCHETLNTRTLKREAARARKPCALKPPNPKPHPQTKKSVTLQRACLL